MMEHVENTNSSQDTAEVPMPQDSEVDDILKDPTMGSNGVPLPNVCTVELSI